MAETTNKLEKLTFVGLYDAETPCAEITVQDDAGLPGVGVQTFKVSVQTIGHYCAEAMTLLISRRVKLGGWSPALKWLPKDDQISTVSGLMITGAVDRLPNIHADWIREVNHLVIEHEKKLVRVTYLDRAGDPQYDVSAPAPSKADDTTVTIQVNGHEPVTMSDQELRDLPGKIRKMANGRQAVRL